MAGDRQPRPWYAPVEDAFHDPRARSYRIVQGFVVLLIILSLVDLGLELAIPLGETGKEIAGFDEAVLALFALELILRVATYRPPRLALFRRSPVWRIREHIQGRLRFITTPVVLVDLVTVIALVPALRGLRALRLFQLVRGLKTFRGSNTPASIFRAFQESRLIYATLFSFLGLVVIIGGVTIYLVEGRAGNPNLQSVADGVWWTLVTMTTVGYGDITPDTTMGRIVGGAIMIVGMFTLAMFAGVVGGTLLSTILAIKKEHFRMSKDVNHVIVLGYDDEARLLLESLRQERVGTGDQVVICEPRARPDDLHADFVWIEGDPTREAELEKIRLAEASEVIVVGRRDRRPQEADAHTILVAFTVRAYLKSHPEVSDRRKPLYLVAEILDPENVEHARAAGADEVIETRRLGYSLLAHAASTHGSGEIMATVASSGQLSLYIGKVPSTQGVPYGELARRLHEERGITVFGVRHPHTAETHLNPEDTLTVQPGWDVIYLASGPVLDQL